VIRIKLSGLAMLSLIAPAPAATIETINRPNEPTRFLIEGEFAFGDEKKFADKAVGIAEGIVIFDSIGGNAFAGIEIGKTIRIKGFSTLVLNQNRCASACALAWLGGQPRSMEPGARVGFHAIYTLQENRATETAPGNAIAGAYLQSLGLPTKAVFYITATSPGGMAWLSFDDAARYGILKHAARATPSPPGQETQPTISSAPQPATSLTTPNHKDASYSVQFAVAETADQGKRSFEQFKKRFPDLLGTFSAHLVRAEADGRQYYRVRFIAQSREHATKVCGTLIQRGVRCFVARE
jgi:hypothetical protein